MSYYVNMRQPSEVVNDDGDGVLMMALFGPATAHAAEPIRKSGSLPPPFVDQLGAIGRALGKR